MVDWDLEAPGLHRYFDHRIQTQSTDRGLLDLLRAGTNSRSGNAEEHSWQSFVSTIYLPDADRLDILTAGHTNDEQYLGELQEFDREKFSGAQEGGRFIESLRNEWRRAYDVVLIDSRIGYRRGLPHWMAPTSSQLAPLTRKPTALTPRGGPPGLVQMCLRETSWRPELMWSASSPAVSEPTGTSYRGNRNLERYVVCCSTRHWCRRRAGRSQEHFPRRCRFRLDERSRPAHPAARLYVPDVRSLATRVEPRRGLAKSSGLNLQVPITVAGGLVRLVGISDPVMR